MSPQEIFNTVSLHLINQRCKSVDEQSYFCCYRGPNGLKCAIGCLIPDNMYIKKMDNGYNVMQLVAEFNLPEYFNDNSELLKLLQIVHDNSDYKFNINKLKIQLKEVATIFNLNTYILETI